MILYPAATVLFPVEVSATFATMPEAVATSESPVSRLPLVTVTVLLLCALPSYVQLSLAAVMVTDFAVIFAVTLAGWAESV